MPCDARRPSCPVSPRPRYPRLAPPRLGDDSRSRSGRILERHEIIHEQDPSRPSPQAAENTNLDAIDSKGIVIDSQGSEHSGAVEPPSLGSALATIGLTIRRSGSSPSYSTCR